MNEKTPPKRTGSDHLPNFYPNSRSGVRPSDFHIWLMHTAPLFDDHIGFAHASADGYVGATGAAFTAKRTDAASVAYFCRARRQRQED